MSLAWRWSSSSLRARLDLSKDVDIVIDIKVMETIMINMAPITAPSVMTITGLDEVTSTSHNNKNTSLENLS